jgi:cytoskeleton protein RodZ
MEQQSEQNNQPDPISVGEALRAGREAAGLSLNEVAERLKLSMRQLEAIERDDFGVLPGPTFVRGFVRNYARFLEIDPTPLMEALDVHFPSAVSEVANLARDESSAERDEDVSHSHGQNRWMVVLLVGVVLGASGLWIFGHRTEPAQPDLAPMVSPQTASDLAAAASSVPMVATPSTVTGASAAATAAKAASAPVAHDASAVIARAAAARLAATKAAASARLAAAKTAASGPATVGGASGKISISVTEPAWVAVVDATGNRLVYSTVEPGSPRDVAGVPPFKVRVGNADKVTVTYNGHGVALGEHTHGTTATLEIK